MKIWKNMVIFYFGGMLYLGLELLWRGWTHGTMFLAGGCSFLLLGSIGRCRLPGAAKPLAAAAAITAVELLSGLLFNRQHQIWDYSAMPMGFAGQICLPFSLLWLALSIPGFRLFRVLDRSLPD